MFNERYLYDGTSEQVACWQRGWQYRGQCRTPPTPHPSTRRVVCFLHTEYQSSMFLIQAEIHRSNLVYISQNLNNEIKVSNKMVI